MALHKSRGRGGNDEEHLEARSGLRDNYSDMSVECESQGGHPPCGENEEPGSQVLSAKMSLGPRLR